VDRGILDTPEPDLCAFGADTTAPTLEQTIQRILTLSCLGLRQRKAFLLDRLRAHGTVSDPCADLNYFVRSEYVCPSCRMGDGGKDSVLEVALSLAGRRICGVDSTRVVGSFS